MSSHAAASGPRDSASAPAAGDACGPVDQVEIGAGRPHDTDTPDIETASDEYAAARFGGAIGQWLLVQQSLAVEELLALADRRPLRVLEVGGGHAQVTPLLIARGHHVVVQGSHRACFGRVQALNAQHPDRLCSCVSNLWRLPFADRAFDMVCAVRLVGHAVRWRELLREMARVSARYLLIEFARAPGVVLPALHKAVFALKRSVERTTRPFYTYREEALVAELRMQGFDRVASVAQFALPMVLHRMAGNPRLSAAAEALLRTLGVGDSLRSPALVLAQRRRDGR